MFRRPFARTRRGPGPTRLAARLLNSISGVAAVEFAIVAPVLFMLIVGMLVYGLYFGTVHSVQQIAADAARASIAGLNDAERASLATSHAETSAGNYGLLDRALMKVDAGASPDDGDVFVVTVSYDASRLPIYSLDGLVPVPSKTISRSASIRRRGY